MTDRNPSGQSHSRYLVGGYFGFLLCYVVVNVEGIPAWLPMVVIVAAPFLVGQDWAEHRRLWRNRKARH